MKPPEEVIPEIVLKVVAIAASAYVIGASLYLWEHQPVRRWPYVVAMGVVALAWVVRYAARYITTDSTTHANSRKLLRSITVAAFLMAIPLTRQLGFL